MWWQCEECESKQSMLLSDIVLLVRSIQSIGDDTAESWPACLLIDGYMSRIYLSKLPNSSLQTRKKRFWLNYKQQTGKPKKSWSVQLKTGGVKETLSLAQSEFHFRHSNIGEICLYDVALSSRLRKWVASAWTRKGWYKKWMSIAYSPIDQAAKKRSHMLCWFTIQTTWLST